MPIGRSLCGSIHSSAALVTVPKPRDSRRSVVRSSKHPSVVQWTFVWKKDAEKTHPYVAFNPKMPETKPKQTTSKRWICKRGNFNNQVIQAVTLFSLQLQVTFIAFEFGGVTFSTHHPKFGRSRDLESPGMWRFNQKNASFKDVIVHVSGIDLFQKQKVRKAVPPKRNEKVKICPTKTWLLSTIPGSFVGDTMGGDLRLTYPK